MRKLTLQEQELNFAGECKLINLKYEYTGYTGTENFAIISELSEEELNQKYPDIIGRYVPFILLSMKHGEVIAEAHRNDDKFAKRAKRNGNAFDTKDEDFEVHHPEVISDTLEDEVFLSLEIEQLHKAINKLNDVQKNRLIKHFFEGKTMREIAMEEQVSVSTIHKSISAAIDNLRKFMI